MVSLHLKEDVGVQCLTADWRTWECLTSGNASLWALVGSGAARRVTHVSTLHCRTPTRTTTPPPRMLMSPTTTPSLSQ